LIDQITIKTKPFLKRIITGDEKWVKCENIKRKLSWSKADESPQTISKPGLTANKVMLSVWWDWKGIIHYELLQRGETINLVLYCAQFDHLNEEFYKERPELGNREGAVFHHDNAQPHTSLVTRNKLTSLGWEILMHPPYSPDLAPLTTICFGLCKILLVVKNWPTETPLKITWPGFSTINHKCSTTWNYEDIQKRQKIINNNGQYVLD